METGGPSRTQPPEETHPTGSMSSSVFKHTLRFFAGGARPRWTAVATVAVLSLGGGSAGALRLPSAPKCPIFPKSNPWNRRVDRLPVSAGSARIIRSIGLGTGLHPDFGSGKYAGGPIGIPFNVVTRKTRRTRLAFEYADESDRGRYPIPQKVKVEHGSDRHALMIDRSGCRLYEVYRLRGRHAGSGAIWNLRSNRLRPAGWTSADAAGLPIFPGLVRWDEVARGRIDHALRFTVERTRRAYVYPARHYASNSNSRSLPPMGLRVRLKARFPISGFPRQARIILKALKRYGMIVADNGSDWFVSGAPDRHWNNDALHTLSRVKGSSFEVLDTRSLRPGGSGGGRRLASVG